MDIYVASSVANVEAVCSMRDQLLVRGHRVTHDWTGQTTQQSVLSGAALKALRSRIAQSDFQGVVAADTVVVLNHPQARSTFTEMGVALALGKVVIVQDAFTAGYAPNIFFDLPDVMHARDAAHVLELVDYACTHRMRTRTHVIHDRPPPC